MGSLGLQGDGYNHPSIYFFFVFFLTFTVCRTWSSGRSVTDGWPDSTPDSESKDWPSSQASPAAAFTDLVPEFEPGKPWKVMQTKQKSLLSLFSIQFLSV